MKTIADPPERDRWARLRFSIIGPLLAAPPAPRQLGAELLALAAKTWRHPVSGLDVRFGVSTLERWYYAARRAADPVAALKDRPRGDQGCFHSLSAVAIVALTRQYREHPGWTAQLHLDNLRVACGAGDSPLASYATVRRYLLAQGMHRQASPRRATAGGIAARDRLEQREVRSFEVEHVGALWHLDFHHASRRVLTRAGAWVSPLLLGVIDDRSRLVCHLQWYLDETARSLVHGLSQAFMKRGLPRALMTDNGAAMLSEEFTTGLATLGVVHQTTLPYSPYQNAKQESFWGRVEGRLMAMLEGEQALTLELLNEATQAWAEQEYHRTVHSELKTTPLERYLAGPSVARPCPDSGVLTDAFRIEVRRRARRSDSTLSLGGQSLRDPRAAAPRERAARALRPLGLQPRRSGRCTHRCRAVPDQAAGQGRQCRWSAPTPGPHGQGPVATDAHGHRAAAARVARPVRCHRHAPGVPGVGPAHRRCRTTHPNRSRPSMNQKLLALYGLKWNPFSPELPTEAIYVPPKLENFCWRIEHAQIREGGFAMIHGDPGTGKSVALRLLADRLARLADVTVGVINHPQSNLADLYRELGEVFAVPLRPHNRWGGFKALRERWLAHLETTRGRALLLIDEAQEMSPAALCELRLMASARFDSQPLLCVVLAGDARLIEKLRREDLIPLGSRIRTRLATEHASREELLAGLNHLLVGAGNAALMTTALRHTLCDHAAGNYRILTTMAAELLAAATQRELPQLDEKLYLEVFAQPEAPTPRRTAARR